MMESFSSEIWSNDLKSFKEYIESDKSTIKDYASSVQYTYGGKLNIFASTFENGINQVFPSPVISYYYPLANCDFTEVQFCEEGETIHAGGLEFKVMATPGHTHGSVCYICQDALFSGDTLFAGSCGRTDLPGGDWDTIHESLRRLAALPKNYTVYPGHGGSTTLADEKKYNPYTR